MTDPHIALLEVYFFAFIDEGSAPDNTPLFTGVYQDRRLINLIAEEFQLTPEKAEQAIDLARKEVEL